LSIGIFFSLMTAGLATSLPARLTAGLTAHGVPESVAHNVAHLPPVSSLFAAFLGTNPVAHLLAPTGVLTTLPAQAVATLTGTQFFPQLISASFHDGLAVVFAAATVMALIGAGASLLRGKRYVHSDAEAPGAVRADS